MVITTIRYIKWYHKMVTKLICMETNGKKNDGRYQQKTWVKGESYRTAPLFVVAFSCRTSVAEFYA